MLMEQTRPIIPVLGINLISGHTRESNRLKYAPLKLFISSARHAIWDAHPFAKSQLHHFFFASNRKIYAMYMPYLFLLMMRLPAEESFNHRHFVAKLTPSTFNSVWMDYVLEATENKALKSYGGIIGLTNQDNALARCFCLVH